MTKNVIILIFFFNIHLTFFFNSSEFVHALGEPGIDEDEEDDEEDLQSPLF